jgi:hypothetical protein
MNREIVQSRVYWFSDPGIVEHRRYMKNTLKKTISAQDNYRKNSDE